MATAMAKDTDERFANQCAQFTERWYTLRDHDQQSAAWHCPARFVGLDAGRRSGKTELAKRKLVMTALDLRYDTLGHRITKPRYFFGAPTWDQAKEIAWEDLLDLIPEWAIAGGKSGPNVRLSNLSIHLENGARICLFGFDKPARFEGRPWDWGVIDEMADEAPGLFDLHIGPALSTLNRPGGCWMIGKPSRQGPGAAWWREFCIRARGGNIHDEASFTWPSWDILPKDEIDRARATMATKDFNEQYGASWENASGRVLYAFDEAINVRPCQWHADMPIIVGMDFNVDPMCWALGHDFCTHMEWFNEIYLTGTNTEASLNVLYDFYKEHKGGFRFYGDSSSKSRQTSASISDYRWITSDPRFTRLGRTMHIPAAHPAVKDRHASANAMYSNAAGRPRMFVDPRCKHLIEACNMLCYLPGTTDVDSRTGYDHMVDAHTYPVHMLHPLPSGQRIVQTVTARAFTR
jgi:hypothetical protein